MDFSTEIQYLKGVGPARAEAFSKLGVDTVGALYAFIRARMRIGAALSP